MKTLVQCDFDGTITEEDVSFLLLDVFAQGDWRQLLREYKEHKISVGEFNTKAFAMIEADEATLLQAIRGKALPSKTHAGRVKVRSGFHELVDYCSKRGFRLVIVSNGLDFYIKAILDDLRLKNIEVHAAQTWFHAEGMEVQYTGPDGKGLDGSLKEEYIKFFLKHRYRVIYIGNGDSDIIPAGYAYQVFATGELLTYGKENNLNWKPFNDHIDIVKALEVL